MNIFQKFFGSSHADMKEETHNMSALTLESVIVPTKFSKGRCALMRTFTPHYLNYLQPFLLRNGICQLENTPDMEGLRLSGPVLSLQAENPLC